MPPEVQAFGGSGDQRYLSANKIGQNSGEVFRGNLESGSKNSLLESLILAQNERWRRG
jgi:hypothetical protein